MSQAQVHHERYIPASDIRPSDTVRFKREARHNVRHKIDDLDYQNSFMPKPVLRPEYSILFEDQGFLCKVCIGCTF